VTPQVFQFIGPSNDGRRHGRGTYLLYLVRADARFNSMVGPNLLHFARGNVNIR
jgi:hypothetical protein